MESKYPTINGKRLQHSTITVSLNLFTFWWCAPHVETTEWEFLENVEVALGVPSVGSSNR